MPGPSRTPAIMQRCVADVSPKMGKNSAFAICTKSLQKSGSFKKGSNKLTAKGAARNANKAKKGDMPAKHHRFEKLLGKSEGIKENLAQLRLLMAK